MALVCGLGLRRYTSGRTADDWRFLRPREGETFHVKHEWVFESFHVKHQGHTSGSRGGAEHSQVGLFHVERTRLKSMTPSRDTTDKLHSSLHERQGDLVDCRRWSRTVQPKPP